jgi:hypothetical protein
MNEAERQDDHDLKEEIQRGIENPSDEKLEANEDEDERNKDEDEGVADPALASRARPLRPGLCSDAGFSCP